MSAFNAVASSVGIPGLLHMPVEDSTTIGDAISLTSFNLKSFTVPASHRAGKCRPVAEFDRIGVVGEGSYGTVYKVKDKVNGNICALKRLKIQKESELMPQNFLREITNLKLLKHDNIVNLLGIAVGKSFQSTYLILEYCEFSLASCVDDAERGMLAHPQIKNIMKQLFTGLDYIHKNFVLHRDISPSNILFNDLGILKITDFGFSRRVAGGDTTPNVGLRWYKAPEILFGSSHYVSSVDVWSCGCIFAELIQRRTLFQGDSDSDVIRLIIDFLGTPTESLWPGYSDLPVPKLYELKLQPFNRIRSTFESESTSTISLLQKTLSYNPDHRPSAEQCMEQPYFTELPLACSNVELLLTLKSSKILNKYMGLFK